MILGLVSRPAAAQSYLWPSLVDGYLPLWQEACGGTVVITELHKASGDTLRHTGRKWSYELNADCQLTELQRITKNAHGEKETQIEYSVFENGKLRAQRDEMGRYRRNTFYEYRGDSILVIAKAGIIGNPADTVRLEWQWRRCHGRVCTTFTAAADHAPYEVFVTETDDKGRTVRQFKTQRGAQNEEWRWIYGDNDAVEHSHTRGSEIVKSYQLLTDHTGLWRMGEHQKKWSIATDNEVPSAWIFMDETYEHITVFQIDYTP